MTLMPKPGGLWPECPPLTGIALRVSTQPIVAFDLLRREDLHHRKMGLEVGGAQARFLPRCDRRLRLDPVIADLPELEQPVEMGFGGDQRFAGGNGILAHPLEHDPRPGLLVGIEAKLVGKFQHMARARIAVQLCGESIPQGLHRSSGLPDDPSTGF